MDKTEILEQSKIHSRFGKGSTVKKQKQNKKQYMLP